MAWYQITVTSSIDPSRVAMQRYTTDAKYANGVNRINRVLFSNSDTEGWDFLAAEVPSQGKHIASNRGRWEEYIKNTLAPTPEEPELQAPSLEPVPPPEPEPEAPPALAPKPEPEAPSPEPEPHEAPLPSPVPARDQPRRPGRPRKNKSKGRSRPEKTTE